MRMYTSHLATTYSVVIVLCLLIAYSSLSNAAVNPNNGTLAFSGTVVAPPCSVEVINIESMKFREIITERCVPSKSITNQPVHKLSKITNKKDLIGYIVSVKYN